MTASKSSRARNARTQGGAARSGNAAADRANRGGSATRTDTAVRTGPAGKGTTPADNGVPARTGTARTGTAKNGTAKTGTARTGTAARTARDGAARASGQARTLAPQADQAPRAGLLAKIRGGLTDLFSGGSAVPPWLRLTTLLLALAGLGVSTYLTIAHFTQSTLAGCSETAGLVDCTKVTTSAQSYVFGIPVAVLGLAFYLFMVAIMSPWAWRATREIPLIRIGIPLIRIGALIVGMGFVLYLLYAELFLIGSICLYCTSVHALTFLLFVLTMFAAAAWGLGPARSES
jgi:uncharacterized membrane protein